ncbi:MAG: methionyl-tRNA formyltransferase [Planctomycetes bacterium]|nr:methionyl-tRNA formyltransferase [Planctomycetota bacterium]
MMGTGTFALPTFRALVESPHDVAGLFTQPDRGGRGHHQHPHPLKEAALAAGVPVFQPPRVNLPADLDELRSLAPDVCVVAAYGQILSPELLAIPRLGAINVHASLLPKYRGAAPVQYAILHGEEETGVTIFVIEPQLDAGPILATRATSIGAKETAGELEERLSALAVPLVLEVLDGFEQGTLQGRPQDPAAVTKAPRLQKEQGLIDWSRPAVEIERHVRALQPWPTAYTFVPLEGRPPLRLTVLSADVLPLTGSDPFADERCRRREAARPQRGLTPSRESGTVFVDAGGERLLVAAGDGAVELERVKPEGRREMTGAEFLRGYRLEPGVRL